MVVHSDEHWMRRALHLAATRCGDTWPNPTVGAVVVRDGQVVGEGAHHAAGLAHAEVVALEQAGSQARGSTLYVTLEPCHHHGRTPPCSLAIHRAGVKRVVYALRDTNPRVSGGGGAWLREQGIEVREGLFGEIAWELNHPFFESGGGARAHLTLKLAQSVDGRIARVKGPTEDGALRRITGEVAHHRVHRMRGRSAVVLVGRRTAAYDHPRLDVRRGEPRRQPRRAVIDPRLKWVPPVVEGSSPWIIFCAEDASASLRRRLESQGHELRPCHRGPDGELEGEEILAQLHEMGLGAVLLEGGWDTASHFLKRSLVDRFHLFMSPRLLGGEGPGPHLWEGAELAWERYLLRRAGEDLEWILRRPGLPGPPCEG